MNLWNPGVCVEEAACGWVPEEDGRAVWVCPVHCQLSQGKTLKTALLTAILKHGIHFCEIHGLKKEKKYTIFQTTILQVWITLKILFSKLILTASCHTEPYPMFQPEEDYFQVNDAKECTNRFDNWMIYCIQWQKSFLCTWIINTTSLFYSTTSLFYSTLCWHPSMRTLCRTSWTSGAHSAAGCSESRASSTAGTTWRTWVVWDGTSTRSSSWTTPPPPTSSTLTTQ